MCVSSTRVPSPSGANETSTRVGLAGSVPGCQLSTSRCGGLDSTISAHTERSPSADVSTISDPSTATRAVAPKTLWVAIGHQAPMSAVKSRNVSSGVLRTVHCPYDGNAHCARPAGCHGASSAYRWNAASASSQYSSTYARNAVSPSRSTW